MKDERVKASTILTGPAEVPNVSKPQIVEDLRAALYCAKVCSYAQGLAVIKAASDSKKWNVDLAMCVKLWKGGCIIRAKLLDKVNYFHTIKNLKLYQPFDLFLFNFFYFVSGLGTDSSSICQR